MSASTLWTVRESDEHIALSTIPLRIPLLEIFDVQPVSTTFSRIAFR
jgi:hypothetical protein